MFASSRGTSQSEQSDAWRNRFPKGFNRLKHLHPGIDVKHSFSVLKELVREPKVVVREPLRHFCAAASRGA